MQEPITFEQLRAFDNELRANAEMYGWVSLWSLGLDLLENLERGWYHCTPTNCLTFGRTGGEGVHFSYLEVEGRSLVESPILVTTPTASSISRVVGEDMRDFLSLGFHRGFFALEQLSHDQELTLEVYVKEDWRPTEQWHGSVGYALREDEAYSKVLTELNRRFELIPWSSKTHFEELQAKYGKLIKYPDL